MEILELLLERGIKEKSYTDGDLYVDNNWFCHVVEDKVRGPLGKIWSKLFKIKHETAIPYGRYEVIVNWSNRFKRLLPLILNVPDFEGIRMHNGATAKNSSGCPIISYKRISSGLLLSKPDAMNDLTDVIYKFQQKGKIFITVTDKNN